MRLEIRSVGIELEGGLDRDGLWSLERGYQKDPHFGFGTDGSVKVNDREHTDLELRYWVYEEKIKKLFSFIKEAFELGFKQNDTCGNHIHLRFRPELGWKLATYRHFWSRFKKEYLNHYQNSDKYLARLSSQWSKGEYSWECGERYRAINFYSLGDTQKTLEFRVFPYAENAHEIIKMIRWLRPTVLRLLREENNHERKVSLDPLRCSRLEDITPKEEDLISKNRIVRRGYLSLKANKEIQDVFYIHRL